MFVLGTVTKVLSVVAMSVIIFCFVFPNLIRFSWKKKENAAKSLFPICIHKGF
jgi:hypothetical protein